MEGWEENGNGGNSRGRNAGIPLGINKRSSKIGKSVKRSSGVIHQPNRQQQQQQAQPPPVYNINKNDFRNVVQRLTGSPLPEPFSSPPPPPPLPNPQQPKASSSRLQKMRPPPLSSVNALPSPTFQKPGGIVTPPFFSPLPPLTPGDAVWANPVESPVSAYMRYLQQSMSNPSPRPILQAPTPPLPSPRALPSPAAQYLLPSPLPSPGSTFPFNMGAYFAQSPSAQFGFPGAIPGSPLLPPSPGLLFPLSPVGRFPSCENSSTSAFSREGFSFPDRNRRL